MFGLIQEKGSPSWLGDNTVSLGEKSLDICVNESRFIMFMLHVLIVRGSPFSKTGSSLSAQGVKGWPQEWLPQVSREAQGPCQNYHLVCLFPSLLNFLLDHKKYSCCFFPSLHYVIFPLTSSEYTPEHLHQILHPHIHTK